MRTTELVVPVYFSQLSLYATINNFFESLRKHYPELPIIAVDDGSPLPTSHWPITYRSRQNKGYTATVNKGLSLSKADNIIVANDDLVFKPGDLDRFFRMEGLVICSPRDTASDPTDKFGSIWGMTRDVYRLLGRLDGDLKHFFSDKVYYDLAKSKSVEIVKWRDIVVDHIESATYKTVDKKDIFERDLKIYLDKYGRR